MKLILGLVISLLVVGGVNALPEPKYTFNETYVPLSAFCSEGLSHVSGDDFCGGLNVVNNYGEQVTAGVSYLEPKVSDAYYQWTNEILMSDVKDLSLIQGGL